MFDLMWCQSMETEINQIVSILFPFNKLREQKQPRFDLETLISSLLKARVKQPVALITRQVLLRTDPAERMPVLNVLEFQ